jgi:vitamin B12 transporter
VTREPGDLPGAVVLRAAGVRRANGISRETAPAAAQGLARLVVERGVLMQKRYWSYGSILAAVLLGAPGLSLSQPAAAPDEAGIGAANSLAQVVVTANRSEKPADQVGQSVTVLTAKDIRQNQELSVSDLVSRTVGVAFDRNGGPGQTTDIFIRGAESDQTLVLLDGVKLNDPTNPGTGYDFANLFTGDISRIEILRGPQSTLYGSEAIGGVVNIITAAPTKPLQADIQGEGGSFATGYLSGGFGGAADGYNWRAAGYDYTSSSVPCFDRVFGGRRPCATHSAGATGRFALDLTKDLQLDERVYYTRSFADFDGFDTPTFTFGDDKEYGRNQQVVDYTGLNLSMFGGRLKNRLAFEYSGVDHHNFDPDQPQNFGAPTTTTFLATGRTYTVEYEGTFTLAPGWHAVFGAQSERSTMDTFSPLFEAAPNRAEQTIASGYAQISGEVLKGVTLTGGVRYDDQSKVGGHFTGQASAAWRLNDGNTILRVSFGQGFKAPSLYQLYSEYGNLALKPEEATGWDAVVEQHFLDGRLVVQAAYFGRVTTNMINFISCFEADGSESDAGLCATHQLGGGYYDNVARTEAEGAEVTASWQVTDQLQLSANYTLDAAKDRSAGSPTLGRQLNRRPEQSANADIGYVWPFKLRTDLAVRFVGASYSDNADTIRLKAYTLVDLRASYPLLDHLEIYGRIENLGDQRYETVYQYGTLPRAAYAGLRLTF